ncbi:MULTISPECIES: hypothetical protein [Actinokineospora]|uniref:Uncharacterized protein n=1 Tax=Actinokineospora fastidiosa TaxID=1816 RepID=A0A918LK72_9PSEU|nr:MULTISPECIES: hypothetical protein [Actinokineospora]UVS79265.1 hypothetical protein Actkin_03012 [Actinokineospora sp. UTMC 2448]GGS60083.1 hypothetical protein GCM10010171_63730 [Actinokineospora fastidiosa]
MTHCQPVVGGRPPATGSAWQRAIAVVLVVLSGVVLVASTWPGAVRRADGGAPGPSPVVHGAHADCPSAAAGDHLRVFSP